MQKAEERDLGICGTGGFLFFHGKWHGIVNLYFCQVRTGGENKRKKERKENHHFL